MSTWSFCNSIGTIVLLSAAIASAADPVASKAPSGESTTTTITARTMTVRNQESKAIFHGAVVLTRGSLVVRSDEMVVYFKQADQSGERTSKLKDVTGTGPNPRAAAGALPTMSNRSVSMIEATGRVTIEKGDGRATCRKAVYYEDGEKIVLTGDPVAWQGGTRVSGEKMTMYLAEDRSVVEGGTQVVIEQEGQESR